MLYVLCNIWGGSSPWMIFFPVESSLLFLFFCFYYFLLNFWKILDFGGVKSSNGGGLAAVCGCVACLWSLWCHFLGWLCSNPMVSLLWVVPSFLKELCDKWLIGVHPSASMKIHQKKLESKYYHLSSCKLCYMDFYFVFLW